MYIPIRNIPSIDYTSPNDQLKVLYLEKSYMAQAYELLQVDLKML